MANAHISMLFSKSIRSRSIRIVAFISGLALTANLAAAANLVPHAASYDLEITPATNSAQTATIYGTMSYQLIDACDGWVLERDSELTVQMPTGEVTTPVKVSNSMRSFESHDGKIYDFVSSRKMFDEQFERREGRVDRASKESSTRVDLSGFSPDGPLTAIDLPSETLFPVAFAERLLESVLSGERKTEILFFDGADEDGVSIVNSTVIAKATSRAKSRFANSPLLSDQVWDITLAYFKLGENVPYFEVSYGLHPSSITERVVLYEEDVTVNMTLTDVKMMDGGC